MFYNLLNQSLQYSFEMLIILTGYENERHQREIKSKTKRIQNYRVSQTSQKYNDLGGIFREGEKSSGDFY